VFVLISRAPAIRTPVGSDVVLEPHFAAQLIQRTLGVGGPVAVHEFYHEYANDTGARFVHS